MRNKKVAVLVSLLFMMGSSVFAKSLVVNDLQDTAHINVSRSNVNRLVFPYKITYQANSKEKDLTVSVVGKEMFVKFTPYIKMVEKTVDGKVVQTGEKRIIYSKSRPAEIYVVTEQKTYSIVLHPKRMESRTVYFTESLREKKKKLFAHKDEDYVTNITKNIIKPILQNDRLQGFDKSALAGEYRSVYLDGIRANLLFKPHTLFKGYRYDAYVYKIKNTNKFMFTIPDSKEILKKVAKDINKKIIAYSIYYNNRVYKILPNQTVDLVVVTEASYD